MSYQVEIRKYISNLEDGDQRCFGTDMVARELKIIEANRGQRIARILSYFKGDKKLRIFDVGCGLGDIALKLADCGHDVVGVDIDPKAIEIAKIGKQELGCENVAFHSTYDTILGMKFEAIVCNQVIEHIPEPLRFLLIIKDYLLPSGVLLLTTPNRLWPIDPHTGKLFMSWFDNRLFTWGKLNRVLTLAGFKVHNMTPFILKHLHDFYETPEHHSTMKFRFSRLVSSILPVHAINLITESFYLVGERSA